MFHFDHRYRKLFKEEKNRPIAVMNIHSRSMYILKLIPF